MEYVDFGNEEEVERLKMRKAPDIELFSLPFQVSLAAGCEASVLVIQGIILAVIGSLLFKEFFVVSLLFKVFRCPLKYHYISAARYSDGSTEVMGNIGLSNSEISYVPYRSP